MVQYKNSVFFNGNIFLSSDFLAVWFELKKIFDKITDKQYHDNKEV